MAPQTLTVEERLNRMYRYEELLRSISCFDDDTEAIHPLFRWNWEYGPTTEILAAFAAADEVSGHSMSNCTEEITNLEEWDSSILNDAWENLCDCIHRLAHGEDVVARNNLKGLAMYLEKQATQRLLDEKQPSSRFSPEDRLKIYNILHDTPLRTYQDLSDIMDQVVSLPCVRQLDPPISLEAHFESGIGCQVSDLQLLDLDIDILSGRDFEYGLRRLGTQVCNWKAIREFSEENPLSATIQPEL